MAAVHLGQGADDGAGEVDDNRSDEYHGIRFKGFGLFFTQKEKTEFVELPGFYQNDEQTGGDDEQGDDPEEHSVGFYLWLINGVGR